MKKNKGVPVGATSKTAAQRLWSFFTSIAVFVAALPIITLSVAAEPVTVSHNINGGNLTISGSSTSNYLIYGNGTASTYYIQVQSGYTGTITIKDIKLRTGSEPCMNILGNANVTLKLMGDNEMLFASGGTVRNAVLQVASAARLTIESYNGVDQDGKLTIVQSMAVSGAAIGSKYGVDNGTIIVNSGTIHTTGGDDSAGIGGGAGGGGGTIVINDGNVTAICDSRAGTNNSAAAIGAGYPCNNNNTRITINGGDITAVSLIPGPNDPPHYTERYLSGAAIGAGNANSNTTTTPAEGNFEYILITGGKIKASVRGDFNGPGGTHRELVPGRDGVAIGGGANPYCKGTIIVLPSADVTELYGAIYRGPVNNTDSCWDIGNADKIFYLNSASARVAAQNSGIVQTKIFTARTQDNSASGTGSGQYTKNADIYVRVREADPYLPAFAAKVGNTGSSGVYGDALNLNYYTNLAVDYFTKSKKVDGSAFATQTVPTNPANALLPLDLNVGEPYNPNTVDVFNLILGDASSTSTGVVVGGPYVNTKTAPVLPTPPGASTATPPWTYLAPQTFQDSGEIDLHFGEFDFGQTAATAAPSADYPNNYNQLKLQIKNTGDLPMNIVADQSGIQSFALSGPGISDPPVAGGENLPPNSEGTIIVKRNNIVRAGERTEPLVLHITNDTVSPPYDKTITINLRIKVNQEELNSTSGNKAKAIAVYPSAPALITDPPTQTNATSVNMTATASNANIDGVKNIWCSVTTSPTGAHTPSPSAGHTPDGDSAWTKVSATPNPDGSYNHSKSFTAPFPAADGTYYIHWYVETENTIASDGVLGPYEVLRDTLQPTLSGPAMVSSTVPYTITVSFNRPVTGLLATHFQVTNGAVVPGTLTATDSTGQNYTVNVQANGNGDCKVMLLANRVKDSFGNYNLVSNLLESGLDNASPAANFSGIKAMYFKDTSGIQFKLSSGVAGDPNLFLSDGTTPFTGANELGAGKITLTRDGSPVALTAADISFSGDTFKITKSLGEGLYVIDIAADSIKNSLGLGIAHSTRAFEVRVPVVSSIAVNPNSYTYTGGNATITVNGVNLQYATAANNKELDIAIADSHGTTHGPLAITITGGVGTATFAVPANMTMYPITYTFTARINGVSTGFSAQAVVAEAPAMASDLLATENSDGSAATASLELTNAGGTVYFVIDGVNLHNMSLGLNNSGPVSLPVLVHNDFALNGTASQAISKIGIALPANTTQTDHVYTFEVTDAGAATGKTVTITVKKPQVGVDASSFTPTYDKHPSSGGTTTFKMTGQHMDTAGTNLTLRVTPVDDDGSATGTAIDHPVTSITNGGSNTTQAISFAAHNPSKLRNDLYKVVVVFNGQEVAGCEAKIEVGDDVPSLTGFKANPNYFATMADTLNGKGKSALTVQGNYLFNFNSLEIHDLLYDRMYTVSNAGKDMEAVYMVNVPSAVGIYRYDLYCEGQQTGHSAEIRVGMSLGQSGPAPDVPTDEGTNTDKTWDRRGGGAKGGGFTGRKYVPFDVLRYQCQVAAKENPVSPSIVLEDIAFVSKHHFDLAFSGGRQGAEMSTKVGDGIMTLKFDTSRKENANILEGRLYIKVVEPLPDVYPGVYVDTVETGETKALFQNRFGNKNLSVICLDQNGTYGAKVEVAAAADLSGFNTNNLYFYQYDRQTGRYSRMTGTEHFIDTEKFLHFKTNKGGDIIVTDKPLLESSRGAAESGAFPIDKKKEDIEDATEGGGAE